MNAMQAALIALLVFWALVAGAYHMGKRSALAKIDKDIIEVMERVRNADLSTGDIAADIEFITDWLRENE